MALFLIKATNQTHTDPVKDQRGCYKRGDIVQVLDDSAHDGDILTNPIMPPFVLVRIVGLSLEKAMKYMEEDAETNIDLDSREIKVVTTRRRWKLRLDDVPLAIKNQLINSRYIEVTTRKIRNYIRDKVTDQDETTLT